MSDDSARELGTALALKTDAQGLFTVVAVDADTEAVLMVAHMNRAALDRTLATRRATYWSRSRQKFWVKGEESGHEQEVREIWIDCDQDAIVLKVRQKGAACHNGYRSCFYRRLRWSADNPAAVVLEFAASPVVDPQQVYSPAKHRNASP